jgi:hypothetical protein
MNDVPFRIHKDSDFDAEVNFLTSIVDRDCCLPAYPFVATELSCQFDEFDWALSGEFWETVQKLSQLSSDVELLMAVLDPDPLSFFQFHFGHFGWARLPVAMTRRQYWEYIDVARPGNVADSILVVSQRIAWVPRSKKWCVWGERDSGLCVIGCSSRCQVNFAKGIDWALNWCRPWADAPYLEKFEHSFNDRSQ